MNKLIDKVADESFVQDFEIDFETLKLTDWKSELRVLTDVLIELLNVYQQSNFRRKNWTKIIDDPNLNKYINDVVEVSMKSTVLKEQILPCLATVSQAGSDGFVYSLNCGSGAISHSSSIILSIDCAFDTYSIKNARFPVAKKLDALVELNALGYGDAFNPPTPARYVKREKASLIDGSSVNVPFATSAEKSRIVAVLPLIV